MNTEALFLFLILLLGLVLCSFLGGNCNKESFTGSFNGNFTVNPEDAKNEKNKKNRDYDNYNHYSGSSSQLTNGTTFYGKNGGSVYVKMQSNGTPMLVVAFSKEDTPVNFLTEAHKKSDANKESFSNYTDKSNDHKFYGPNGETGTVINYDGHQAIEINTKSGRRYIFTLNNPVSSNESNSTPFNSKYSHYHNTPSTYFGSTGVNGANINNSNKAYNDSSSSSLSQSRQSTHNSHSSYDYKNSLPPGIPKSQIVPGDEHLYILKSEVVPPVCPACPPSTTIPRQEQCPPCPACARCPEPSFECKKVPNYNAINNEYLPIPMLNDFSSFGM